MEQSHNQSSQPLFTLTGNPFVDAGLAVICAITEKQEIEEITTEDLNEAIKEAFKFYSIKEWRGALQGLIFFNAEIGNPSVRNKRPNAYYEVLEELVNNLAPLNNQGNCVICGKRNGIPNTRTRIPMLGSKKMVNFFPAHQSGENICSGCTLATQFVPFFVVSAPLFYNKKSNKLEMGLLLFQSSIFEILKIYAKKQYSNHNLRFTQAESRGFLISEKISLNSIFEIVEELASFCQEISQGIARVKKIDEINPHLTFYHFSNAGRTNFNASLKFYYFPNDVFHFIKEIIQNSLQHEWRKVVFKGFKNTSSDKIETAFKYNNRNTVYIRLLEGRSITSFLYDKRSRRNVVSWSFVELYLQVVRKMNEEKIKLIKKLGDKIAFLAEENNNINRINAIDRAKSYLGFRTVLIKLSKEWLALKRSEPFITVDDYLMRLLPDGPRNWHEIRDLLLIRIYEVATNNILNKIAEKVTSETIDEEEDGEEE